MPRCRTRSPILMCASDSKSLGQVIFPAEQQTPQGLAAYHAAEIAKWWPIIKAADIKAE